MGSNLAYTHLNYPTYERGFPAVDNIYEWDGDPHGKRYPAKTEESLSRLIQSGVYAAVRLKPYDPLSIILGSRVTGGSRRTTAATI